jgi:hypothetical protein
VSLLSSRTVGSARPRAGSRKAAAVAVAAVGAGGVALAASTGALPNPLTSHPSPASSVARAHASAKPSASERGPGNADPSPALVGLCRAYTAGAGSEHGKALENPAFNALITAAGGKDKVDGYCTRLLAASPSASHPGGKGNDDHPSGAPSDHPTGAPTDHPTDHPTGRPSPHPTH